MTMSAYPVHVDASLDSHLSRWLWLVKWLLAIPHFIVLAFLWVAFFLLSVVAFFAIAFTGRYPRSIFDFNVGVMRWSWRVSYYTYNALGTDRYPPFTLAEVPEYPAHLTVDYPEHLSRGLVWVKWWLLAIPHYLIVGLLVGGTWFAWETTTQPDGGDWSSGWGLIGLLVFISAVALLFTGRYPQQLFDLVLGLNRWVLRVAAYAALMTDEYPPFRLDMGGPDPSPARFAMPAGPPTGTGTVAPTAAAPPLSGDAPSTAAGPAAGEGQAPGAHPSAQAPSAAPPAGGGGIRWTAGRVVTVVVAAFVFLMAGGLLAGGTTLAVADQTARNDQGYLMSPTETLSTGTYAIDSSPLNIESGSARDWVPRSLIGTVAVQAQGTGGEDIFVGVARTSDAAEYLAGVRHATLLDLRGRPGDATPVFQESSGRAPTVLPGNSDIWVAKASGTGQQELTWDPKDGDWTAVVMNSDGSAGVTADVALGATAPVLNGVMVGLFVAGGILLVLSIALVLIALNVGRHHADASTGTGVPAGGGPTGGAPPQERPQG